jgi:hypothetical protein
VRNPHHDLHRADVEPALDEPGDNARRQLPELGGSRPVGGGEAEDPAVFAQHLGLAGQVHREEGEKGLLHRNKPAHLHAYCFQLLQGIQKEADAPAMHSHGAPHRGGKR